MKAARLLHLLACLLLSNLAQATEPATGAEPNSSAPKRPRGRPSVKLDRLDFPRDVPNWWYYKKHLRTVLRREARRTDWGAGRGSTITYRFTVKELTISQADGVLRVTCKAVGRLPKGKTAKSNLTYGGDPRRRNAVVNKVLQIVARGVIIRLAELERVRRGDLKRSRVRRPTTNE